MLYCLAALLTIFLVVSHWDISLLHLFHVFQSVRLLSWLILQSIVFIPQRLCVVIAAQLFPLVSHHEKAVFHLNYYQVMLCSFELLMDWKLFLCLESIPLRLSLWRCFSSRSPGATVNVRTRKPSLCASVTSFLRLGEGCLFLLSFPLCHF